jgi:hypothetical protein
MTASQRNTAKVLSEDLEKMRAYAAAHPECPQAPRSLAVMEAHFALFLASTGEIV